MHKLRPEQEKILSYRGGRMGISAVPGSGKTWTLSLLAAQIIANGRLAEDQEVLIVTLVNSAVDNFYQMVSSFIKEQALLPNVGYRVRTLHGLAHDIVRARPTLAGVSDDFQIVDERESQALRNDVARAWMRSNINLLEEYLKTDLRAEERGRTTKVLTELVQDIALSTIRSAKNMQLTPEQLRMHLDKLPVPLPLAEMGYELYADYQRGLLYRGGIDFDDLIRLALLALESDQDYLLRLRYSWPYILEDEAQDSNRLQEQILTLLAGPAGNWVRVGDPNQAIYETFTTANPIYLRNFIRRVDVEKHSLPISGRSTYSIIQLANHMVQWTQTEHPMEAVRDALEAPPWIEPTPPNDPQPNPPDDPTKVYLVRTQYSPKREVEKVTESLARWVPENPEATVAVLVPRNTRGFELADALKLRRIDYEDGLLRSSSSTRSTAGLLQDVLDYLSDPLRPNKLATVYHIWQQGKADDSAIVNHKEQIAELIRKITRVEEFLWQTPGQRWPEEVLIQETEPEIYNHMQEFKAQIQRWQAAILLPVDQLILTLAQDLFRKPTDLALAHKLAIWLRRAYQVNPTWRLPELRRELEIIAKNDRRFLGFDSCDSGFDPEQYRGRVVISTMHKAKGLEWDRVYLMSVNNYDFPSGLPHDTYQPEKWFIRDSLNLEAEALAQLEVAVTQDEYKWYQENLPTYQARLDYVRERLRLLYVGITRAKKELIITWNTGRNGKLQPAIPLVALWSYWEQWQSQTGTNISGELNQ